MINGAAPLAFALALTTLSGCFVGYHEEPAPPPPVNTPPILVYADAGCEYDPYYNDYVWWFEADADDYDGPGDVIAVWADVYDNYDGAWIDGFDLYYEAGLTWYSAWVGQTTYLDCRYLDHTVEITAIDSFEEADIVALTPIQLY